MLTCPKTREQYIGSAIGEEGFWQRWQDYAQTGHGGNVALKSREPNDYQVSILEIAGTAATTDDFLAMEIRLKKKLQSWEMGLKSELKRRTIMYTVQTLKPKIFITPTNVECPVLECDESVERQRKSFRREARFQCPKHQIYISPSTFEYPEELDNLLWKSKEDQALLAALKRVKRESRMARDNSEDALTWNVFRYLETANLLSGFLSNFTQKDQGKTELIYWSYSQVTGMAMSGLDRARKEFGENLQRSSEPDLIVVTDKALFFIEAKLTAKNDTTPSNPKEHKKYLSGGGGWFRKVFISEYESVAIQAEKYELMRFWLLGSWLGAQTGLDFYLVNLVPSAREIDIEAHLILTSGGRTAGSLDAWHGKIYIFGEQCTHPKARRKATGCLILSARLWGMTGSEICRRLFQLTQILKSMVERHA